MRQIKPPDFEILYTFVLRPFRGKCNIEFGNSSIYTHFAYCTVYLMNIVYCQLHFCLSVRSLHIFLPLSFYPFKIPFFPYASAIFVKSTMFANSFSFQFFTNSQSKQQLAIQLCIAHQILRKHITYGNQKAT